MIAKALASEIRDAVVTATHPCSLLDPLRKARDFISAIAEAMPHEVGKIQERYIAYMQTLVSLEPHRNPLAAQLADDVATLLNITLQQAATIEQQQKANQQEVRELREPDHLHMIESALPELPVGLAEHVAVWRAALEQPMSDRRGLPSEQVVSWFESLLAIIQRQTETIERQRAWSGALQQADREIHELKESRAVVADALESERRRITKLKVWMTQARAVITAVHAFIDCQHMHSVRFCTHWNAVHAAAESMRAKKIRPSSPIHSDDTGGLWVNLGMTQEQLQQKLIEREIRHRKR